MLKHKIKELREGAGMSKADMARTVGVSDVTIGYWETGAIKSMSVDNILKLAAVFGLSVSEMLDDPLKDKPGLEWSLDLCEEGYNPGVITESIKTRLEKMK